MSQREMKRRKILKYVMKQAWNIYFKASNISFSIALKAAWRIVRGYSRMCFSKLRGVTFLERQKILKRLSQYPINRISLSFLREIDNTHDQNAVQVLATVSGRGSAIIGYLSRDLSSTIAPALDSGRQAIVIFDCITGLNNLNTSLGLNFSFIVL